MSIKITKYEEENINNKYEATLENYEFQNIMDGFKYSFDNYFATYGRTADSAKNKMIKEIKKIQKITKRFNELEFK